MGAKFWQYSMVLAVLVTLGALACEVLPTALDNDFLDEGTTPTIQTVARDGDDEGCWYLVWYYLDTGEVFNTQLLYCKTGGSGSKDPPVNIRLGCDSEIRRGSVGGCRLTTDPSDARLTDVEWTFTTSSPYHRSTRRGGRSWEGHAVVDGTITVTGTAHPDEDDSGGNGPNGASGSSEGIDFTQTFDLAVSGRTSHTWTASNSRFVSSRAASPPTLDRCVGGAAGVAGDINGPCGSYINDRTVPRAGRGSGPWQNYYMVLRHNTSVDVFYQLHSDYRTDGIAHNLNGRLRDRCGNGTWNMYYVNGRSCARPNQYASARSHIHGHEAEHVNLAERQWYREELFEQLEELVTTNQITLVQEARTLIRNAAGNIKSAANHHGGPPTILRYWNYVGGLWDLRNVQHAN